MWGRAQCKIGKLRVAKTILTRSAGSFRGPRADFGTRENMKRFQKTCVRASTRTFGTQSVLLEPFWTKNMKNVGKCVEKREFFECWNLVKVWSCHRFNVFQPLGTKQEHRCRNDFQNEWQIIQININPFKFKNLILQIWTFRLNKKRFL